MPKVRVVLEVDVCAKTGAVVCVEEVCEEKPKQEAAPTGTQESAAQEAPEGEQPEAPTEGPCKAEGPAAPAATEEGKGPCEKVEGTA